MNSNLQKYVDQYNKSRLTIAALGLGLALFVGIANERYAYNALLGPFPITMSQLREIKSIHKLRQYYVLVQGQKIVDTGLAWVKTKRSRGSDTVVQDKEPSDYLELVLLDQYLLPYKTDKLSTNPIVIGSLEAPDEKMAAQLTEIAGPVGAAHILPLQLVNGDGFKAGLFFYFVWIFVLGGLGLTNLLRVFVFWKEPENHPLGKAMAAHGGYNTMRLAIEEEFSKESSVLGGKGSNGAVLSNNWILLTVNNKPRFIPIKELVWGYAHHGSEKTNFITSSSYALVLCTTRGEELKIAMPDQDVTTLLAALSDKAPWMMLGFDGKMALRWAAHKKTVIAEIEKKRDEYLQGKA